MVMKPVLVAAAILLVPISACASQPSVGGPANGPLWRADGNGGVLPSPGSVATTGNCWRVSMSLRLDASSPPAAAPVLRGAPAHCLFPSVYVGYLRDTLFLEGLDAAGARLFVATGFNPLHQTAEAPPSPGAGAAIQSTDRPAARVDTLISVPVAAPLAWVRWYDVDANQQPRLLGETAWAGVKPAAP